MTARSVRRRRCSFSAGISRAIVPIVLAVSFLAGCDRRSGDEEPVPEASGKVPQVRVLLLDDANSCSVESDAQMWVSGGPKSEPSFFLEAGSRHEIYVREGHVIISGRTFEGDFFVVSGKARGDIRIDGLPYRGTLEIRKNSGAATFSVVNHLNIESYLAGVVGGEMPKGWEPEALKAQAIAARSYCIAIERQFGGQRSWDVRSTTANQVYLGIRGESRQVQEAVTATSGLVLVTTEGGRGRIFPAYYSSACGGHTENCENVFGDSYGPLCGVVCPYCTEVARAKYFYWPMARQSKGEASRKLLERYPQLRALGKISDIQVLRQSDYGDFSRITLVRLVGKDGRTDTIRGEDLRLTLDPSGNVLRSASFNLASTATDWVFTSGRGYGHGVGLCQCGAQGMARKGYSAEEILGYYYPGARIDMLY